MRLKHFGKHPYFNRRQNLADALYQRAKKILKKNMRLNTSAFNRTKDSLGTVLSESSSGPFSKALRL